MQNLAGSSPEVADRECRLELEAAGIPIPKDWPECLRSTGEVPSNIVGIVNGWFFRRAWYYWVAEWTPPAPVVLTMAQAIELHKTHGRVVRVNGHCGCPAPDEWWPKNGTPNHYHIDSQEGLNAFAAIILTYGLEAV